MEEQIATGAFQQIYRRLFHQSPPERVTFGESSAEIIRPGRGFVDSFDLTMQTQVGCPAGCLFCYVPAGRMLTPDSVRGERGENWGFTVRSKRDVSGKLGEHLQNGDLADKTIYWSGVTDPYATRASETRGIWRLLCAAPLTLRPRRIVIQTRFRPDRDVEWIADYNQTTRPSDDGPAVVVSYSIGTDRDDLIRAWERATPLFAQRMMVIEALRKFGIWVVPTLSPFGLWDNLSGTLCAFKALDIPYITCLFFKEATGSANTPPHFLRYLRHEYPMLLDPIWQNLQKRVMKHVYGDQGVLPGKTGFTSLTAPHLVLRRKAS